MDPVEYCEADEDESEADAEGSGLLHSSSFVGNVSRITAEPAAVAAALFIEMRPARGACRSFVRNGNRIKGSVGRRRPR